MPNTRHWKRLRSGPRASSQIGRFLICTKCNNKFLSYATPTSKGGLNRYISCTKCRFPLKIREVAVEIKEKAR
jgi:hypothetical protein